jgi:lysophospholipase L1-like esterase
MWNRIVYAFELLLLLPILPLLYFQGKKLRGKISKLQAQSGFLALKSKEPESNILIIGESTAAGVGATSPQETIAQHVYDQLEQKHTIINLGKNGLSAEKLKRLLLHGKPDIPKEIHTAVILIGANDCFKFTPPGKFNKHVKEFVLLLSTVKGVEKIILPPIPPVHQFPSIPKIIRFFLGWHRSILTTELAHLAKRIPEMVFENIDETYLPEYFAEDGIHPSDLGNKLLAKEIVKKVAI